jgi:hypothetical protein
MNFKDTLKSNMLLEANLANFHQKYSDIATPEQIQLIHDNSLPESNKSNEAMDLVLRHLKQNPDHLTGLTAEDSDSNLPTVVKNLIHAHTFLKNSIYAPKDFRKHLNQYNDLGDLFKSMDGRIDYSTGGLLDVYKKNQDHKKTTEKIFEDDSIVVKKHTSHASMIKAAYLHPQNTKYHSLAEPGRAAWCVSRRDSGLGHFNHYSDNGKSPFYTVETKDDSHRKFAVDANPSHIRAEEESLWDEPDSPISIGEMHEACGDSIFKNHELGNYLNEFPYAKMMKEKDPDKITHSILTNEHGIENSEKLMLHDSLTPEHLKQIVTNLSGNDSEYSKHNSSKLLVKAINNKNANSDVLHHVLTHMIHLGEDSDDATNIGNAIVDNPSFKKEHIDHIVNYLSSDMRGHFFYDASLPSHKDVTEDHHKVFLNDDYKIASNSATITKDVSSAFKTYPMITIKNNPHVTKQFVENEANDVLERLHPEASKIAAVAAYPDLSESTSHKLLDKFLDRRNNIRFLQEIARNSKHLSVQKRLFEYGKDDEEAHKQLLGNSNLHDEVFSGIAKHVADNQHNNTGIAIANVFFHHKHKHSINRVNEILSHLRDGPVRNIILQSQGVDKI